MGTLRQRDDRLGGSWPAVVFGVLLMVVILVVGTFVIGLLFFG